MSTMKNKLQQHLHVLYLIVPFWMETLFLVLFCATAKTLKAGVSVYC